MTAFTGGIMEERIDVMSAGELAVSLGPGLLCILLPIAAFMVLRRRFPSTWKVFFYGALTFFLFQLVLRLPWQIPLSNWASQQDLAGWGFLLFVLGSALTAGLFEETGRYLAYKWWVKRPSFGDGLTLGLGHGGFESAVLVGFSLVANAVVYYMLSNQLITLPAEQAAAVLPVLEATYRQSWYYQYLPLYERAITLILHVTMSLLVWVAYVQRKAVYFIAALLLHVLIDAVGGVFYHWLQWHILIVEGILTAMALFSIFWMRALYRKHRTIPS